MTDYAKLGTVVLLQRHAPPLSRRSAYPQAARTGWTSPTTIYDKMRGIDPAARELNALVVANVQKPLLRSAWAAWYQNWQAFFAKYQDYWAKVGVFFYSDDLARQTEAYRTEFASFRATYAAERDEKGLPLLQPSAPIPPVLAPEPTPEEKAKKPWFSLGIEIPWWIWAIGGAGVVVGGYYAYKVVQAGRQTVADTKAKQRALEGTLPKLLGPDLGQAAMARAPSQDPSRDLAPSDLFKDAP
jgi:hypothetical protein